MDEIKPPGRPQQDFTSQEMALMYAIVDEYGNGYNKKDLLRELKSLLKYDRYIMKIRVWAALKKVL